MKNLFLLPTDKPSRLFNCFGKLEIGDYTTIRENLQVTNQHIYITNDEEIKSGDGVILISGRLVKAEVRNGQLGFQSIDSIAFLPFKNDDKKIILTTDQELIADGVQAIDDDFLEWFVKNPSCDKVETYSLGIKNEETGESCHYKYEIIIPKEEPKQDLEKEMFDLEQELDIPSHLRWHNSKPKQETLEEAAETTAIRFLEWYRLKRVFFQFHSYHIPNMSDKNWETTVFSGENSYLNASQLFKIFKKES